MNLMPEEVCNINGLPVVQCLEKDYSPVSIENILNEINEEYDFWIKNPRTNDYEPFKAEYLSDKESWASNFFYNAENGLYQKVTEKTGNPGIGYRMGRNFFSNKAALNFLGPIISPKGMIERMPGEMKRWNHTKEGIIMENENGYFRFAIQHKPEMTVSDTAVYYHLGLFDGVAEACGLVGFRTKLIAVKDENRYLEFEGEYKYHPLLVRLYTQYLVKRLPHVKENEEETRSSTIESKEASIRAEHVKREYRKFVPPRIVDDIDKGLKPKIGLKNQSLSILYTDIRDFTGLTERTDPQVLGETLNQYFGAMGASIQKHNGWIDKYRGDAMMVLFEKNPSAFNSVSCAIDMRFALRHFNDMLQAKSMKGLTSFQSGIGITTGNVFSGNIGSRERMDRTVIGDKANTASRLEGLTKEYRVPIIIDESTYRSIEAEGGIANFDTSFSDLQKAKKTLEERLSEGKVFAREIGLVCPKGKNNAIKIYEIMNSYAIDILLLRAIYNQIYKEALELSRCESRDLKEIETTLKKSGELFRQITDCSEREHARIISELDNGIKVKQKYTGDYICQQKVAANENFLDKLKLHPEFFANPHWFVTNFDNK